MESWPGTAEWQAWWERLRERWQRRRNLWRNWRRERATNLRRRRARLRQWWAETWPGWAMWVQVLGGWGLVTWAVVDAVPAGWETVVWKASSGLLLAGLVGWRTWGKLLGTGVHVLREMDKRERR